MSDRIAEAILSYEEFMTNSDEIPPEDPAIFQEEYDEISGKVFGKNP